MLTPSHPSIGKVVFHYSGCSAIANLNQQLVIALPMSHYDSVPTMEERRGPTGDANPSLNYSNSFSWDARTELYDAASFSVFLHGAY